MSTFCCWTNKRIPLYWSHCTVFPRSMAVVIAPENKLQFDSVCPLGDGDAGASSVAAETLRFTDGVTAGSLHTKLQRFLMILGFGQGSLSMHSSNSFANALADRVFHKKEKRKVVYCKETCHTCQCWQEMQGTCLRNFIDCKPNIIRLLDDDYYQRVTGNNKKIGQLSWNCSTTASKSEGNTKFILR